MSLIIFVFYANPALASEWILYEKSATGDEYYDQSSIQKSNNNIHRVRIKKIYNDVGKVENYSVLKRKGNAPANPYMLSHEIALWEINCLNGKMRISSQHICNKRGEVIASMPFLHDPWMKVAPNSKFEKIKSKVCDPIHLKRKKK